MAVATRVEEFGPVTRLHLSRSVAGRPLYWTSVYHWGGVLVDCGGASGRAGLERFLIDHPVTDVLITHSHEDHVGNAAFLAREGATLHAPEPTVAALRTASSVPFYRWAVWGNREPAPAKALPPRVEVEGRRFRVVHTPGHSPDHVAFFEEEAGWLFAGDAFLGRLRVARPEENVPQMIASLQLMQALSPERLFPAHGPAIARRPGEALSDAIVHLEGLQSRAQTLHSRGRSVREITRDLLGPEPFLTYLSGGEFSAQRLIQSLVYDSAVSERELPSPFAPPRSAGGPLRADGSD